MSEHTPGPWHVGESGVTVFSNDDIRICSAGCHPQAEINAANARLIAAAPDLLEALEIAKNTVECASIDIQTGDELPWYRAAKKAIAKAKGETP
jgi:hypothetical protein